MMIETLRTVVQNYDHLELAQMFERFDGMADRYWAALGRLSWWGMESSDFAFVNIYMDVQNGMLTATYRRDDNDAPRFTLGAVWDEASQSFSFHS
jgi:hypothetical protein